MNKESTYLKFKSWLRAVFLFLVALPSAELVGAEASEVIPGVSEMSYEEIAAIIESMSLEEIADHISFPIDCGNFYIPPDCTKLSSCIERSQETYFTNCPSLWDWLDCWLLSRAIRAMRDMYKEYCAEPATGSGISADR